MARKAFRERTKAIEKRDFTAQQYRQSHTDKAVFICTY